MATAGAADDQTAAGRAAADRLANEWDDRAWVPLDVSTEWASAAVERLGEIIAAQPAMLRASLKGADRGASTLSPRPFQGIVECLQNADDLRATRLQIAYRDEPEPALLIVHDGSPVTLANVGAMLLPWLSTKDDDPDAAGRFGIGQRTLSSLGGPIALHAPPFHFVMKENGPEVCAAEQNIEDFYDSDRRDTMLIIPLLPTVTFDGIVDAVTELDVNALVFLKSIRRMSFRRLGDASQNLDFAVEIADAGTGVIEFGGEEATVVVSDVRVLEPHDASTRWYRRYSTRRKVKAGEKRSNKATGATTPISVCVPMDVVRPLRLYDRMPLPVVTGLTVGLDAQFDPDSARSMLQSNKWNKSRFADLGRLTTWAALHAFAADASSGWNHVPLVAEVAEGAGWLELRIRELVASCQAALRAKLVIQTDECAAPLADIAYEAEELEALLTPDDVERLVPGSIALPQPARDAAGRWRKVIAELDRSTQVDVFDSLAILEGDPARGSDWYVAFAALAESHGFFAPFIARNSVFLADGTVCAPPEDGDAWVLVKEASPSSLVSRLGLARQLHPGYLAPDAPTAAFVAKLEAHGVLFSNRDQPADVFAILGRISGDASNGDPIRLEDPDLLALRDAWAALPRERHTVLGPKVGQHIGLKAIWHRADGLRMRGWARPVELYLPAAIDREVDNFAKAAARAPGLKWADPEYARLLKQKEGRSAIGAQRLLVAWGVAREPRLVRPADEVAPWVRDTRAASPVATNMRTEEQLRSIHATPWVTHLLEDHWSPDADVVAADIANAPVKTRRKRAMALLATLSRGWERRYSDAATAAPAYAYNGYWHESPEVRATWLARLADIKWMPDAGNGLQRPTDLQLQVPGSPPRPNERSSMIAKVDTQILRTGILPALGVKAGPTQRDLLERLRALQKLPLTPAVLDDALAIYQLLAASLRDGREGVPEGRLTPAQLKNAFRAGSDGPGLLVVGGQWTSPETVLRGPAIFGGRRAFAPHIDGLDPLWTKLGVELPTASDAIAVLREMADGDPTPADLGVAIRALTLIAGKVPEMSSQMRATLRKLPLWTGSGWTTQRPVYAFEGEGLLASAPPTMPVWRPGLTSFDAFGPLLEPLGVIRLSPAHFKAVSTPAYGLAEGEAIRPTFARAVALLRQELVRADQGLLDGLTVEWDDLLTAPVVVDPELAIAADLDTGSVVLTARAHLGREPLRLIVRSELDAATAEGAGAAIASLFEGDRQKAAWAWAAVWPRALAGEQASGAEMPKMRPERGGGKERLEELARQAAQRRNADGGKTGRPKPKKTTRTKPIQVRKLRELGDLEPSAGIIVNEGAEPSGDLVFTKRRKGKERKFNAGAEGGGNKDLSRPRTVLPPSNDRETMALDAVRRALQLDVPRLNDLRKVRGVGVDAIDELRQCYEIKMSSAASLPTDVTLTASEVEAAKNDPDFFLAIVTGLEDGVGELRVRFIFDPLSNLDVRIRGDLTLTGVDKAEALEFTFTQRSTVHHESETS